MPIIDKKIPGGTVKYDSDLKAPVVELTKGQAEDGARHVDESAQRRRLREAKEKAKPAKS